jgi:hypothetical protein
MGKHVKFGAGADLKPVPSAGIKDQGLVGAYRGLIWTSGDFSFASVEAAKSIANFNAGIVAGDLISLGEGKFTDQSTAATFFTDAPLNIRLRNAQKIKTLQFDIAVNACTRAELECMDGRSGRVFLVTDYSYLIGRTNDDGTVQGMPLSSIEFDDIEPTDGTPVKYMTVTMTFSDRKGDIENPFQDLIDWGVCDLDLVFGVAGTTGNVSTNGDELTFELTALEGLGGTPIEGITAAELEVTDDNGLLLPIVSATPAAAPNAHVYTVVVTTALTSVNVSTQGIVVVNGVPYVLNNLVAAI